MFVSLGEGGGGCGGERQDNGAREIIGRNFGIKLLWKIDIAGDCIRSNASLKFFQY